MKTTALLLSLLLFAACASPTAVIDHRNFNCDPGQPLEIAAGYDAGEGEMGNREFVVEVANNSELDVTVKQVRVEGTERSRWIGAAYETKEVTIASGEDHLFRLKASLPYGQSAVQSTLGTRSAIAEIQTTVLLTNGDAYRCLFRVEVK